MCFCSGTCESLNILTNCSLIKINCLHQPQSHVIGLSNNRLHDVNSFTGVTGPFRVATLLSLDLDQVEKSKHRLICYQIKSECM